MGDAGEGDSDMLVDRRSTGQDIGSLSYGRRSAVHQAGEQDSRSGGALVKDLVFYEDGVLRAGVATDEVA